MIPYWLLLAFVSAGAMIVRPRNDQKNYVLAAFFLAGILSALMVGLRYRVGADWEPYRIIYWEMRFANLPTAIARSDPSFGLLNWAVRQAGWDFWVVNLFCASVFVYGLFRFAAKQASPWTAVMISVPYLIIVVGMGYARQATALGFIMLALACLQEKSLRKFIVFMILAATFHRSSVILLPIIGLSYSRNRLLSVALALVATVIAYVFIVAPEVDTYIDRYSGAEQGAIESSGTLVRIAMNAMPAFIYLLNSGRFPVRDDLRLIWRNLSILALISLAAYLYFGPNTALDRLSIYLNPLQIFVFGNLPVALGSNERPNRFVIVLCAFYALAIQVVWLLFASNARYWIPYRIFPF